MQFNTHSCDFYISNRHQQDLNGTITFSRHDNKTDQTISHGIELNLHVRHVGYYPDTKIAIPLSIQLDFQNPMIDCKVRPDQTIEFLKQEICRRLNIGAKKTLTRAFELLQWHKILPHDYIFSKQSLETIHLQQTPLRVVRKIGFTNFDDCNDYQEYPLSITFAEVGTPQLKTSKKPFGYKHPSMTPEEIQDLAQKVSREMMIKEEQRNKRKVEKAQEEEKKKKEYQECKAKEQEMIGKQYELQKRLEEAKKKRKEAEEKIAIQKKKAFERAETKRKQQEEEKEAIEAERKQQEQEALEEKRKQQEEEALEEKRKQQEEALETERKQQEEAQHKKQIATRRKKQARREQASETQRKEQEAFEDLIEAGKLKEAIEAEYIATARALFDITRADVLPISDRHNGFCSIVGCLQRLTSEQKRAGLTPVQKYTGSRAQYCCPKHRLRYFLFVVSIFFLLGFVIGIDNSYYYRLDWQMLLTVKESNAKTTTMTNHLHEVFLLKVKLGFSFC
jgi:hypothetical protein